MPEHNHNLNIAVVGGGISGLASAWLLSRRHRVTLFEAGNYAGGHTNTVDVETPSGETIAVDTGFIVFNDRNYPNFNRMLKKLGVESQPTTMGFSVKCERTGLEYSGSSLNALFSQRKNLFRPAFYRMLWDIMRFNRKAPAFLSTDDSSTTLSDYLNQHDFSPEFINYYSMPMGAALWSASLRDMSRFPARTFIQFFNNHGLLSLRDRPNWKTVRGGSRKYVEKLLADYSGRILLNSPVQRVRRLRDGVEIHLDGGRVEKFDKLVLAVHSDQALKMLDDPSEQERQILGAIPYQRNTVILHTDKSVLPRNRRAWASWNYHILDREQQSVAITYNMDILQRLGSEQIYCVTLNVPDAIDPDKIIREFSYDHPVFNAEGVAAQRRRDEINGVRNTFFAGAYWGYGFHEDGMNSALEVCRHFGIEL